MATATELQSLLGEAQEKIAEYEKVFAQLKEIPLDIATVVGVDGKRMLLDRGGKLSETSVPQSFKVTIGDQVLVHPLTGGVLQMAALTGPSGIANIKEVISDKEAVVEMQHGQEAVLPTKVKCHAGDRVILSGSAVVRVLERKGSSQYLQSIDTKVEWTDVKGQAAAIKVMREVIEWPRKHKELLKAFNRQAPKGMMLWGPPGCGKTLLAKAAVNALNKDSKTPGFFYVKGPELLKPYVGKAEEGIREIFAQARQLAKLTGETPIIFIDEADAILPKRGSGISTDVFNTIVPQFLSEMDGLEEGGPFLLLATNLPGSLDSAVVRPGRIDHAVEIKRPDQVACAELFNHYLEGIPRAEPTEDYGDYATARIFKRDDLELENEPLSEKLSGAFVAGAVKESVSIAIRRNIESPKTKDKGLLRSDVAAALVNSCQSRRFTNETKAPAPRKSPGYWGRGNYD